MRDQVKHGRVERGARAARRRGRGRSRARAAAGSPGQRVVGRLKAGTGPQTATVASTALGFREAPCRQRRRRRRRRTSSPRTVAPDAASISLARCIVVGCLDRASELSQWLPSRPCLGWRGGAPWGCSTICEGVGSRSVPISGQLRAGPPNARCIGAAGPRAGTGWPAPKLCKTRTLHERCRRWQKRNQGTATQGRSRSRQSRRQEGGSPCPAAGRMSAALQSREDERACGMQARVSLCGLQAAPTLLSAPAIMRAWLQPDADRDAAPPRCGPGSQTPRRPPAAAPPAATRPAACHAASPAPPQACPRRSESWRP